MTFEAVSPDEVARRDDVVLIDVREPHEWNAGHIAAASNIPMGELAARQAELPADQTIVCVCRSGHRSGLVTDALVRAGYDALNLDGGMLAWVEAQLPYVDQHGQPGRIA